MYNVKENGSKESAEGVTIIGGGLAGCEAACAASRLLEGSGRGVTLYEMKPARYSPAHASEDLSELVCSNSLKSEDPATAHGLLKAEMRLLGSVTMLAADNSRVPAGGALAVDRAEFARLVTGIVKDAGVRVVREEVTKLPPQHVRPLVIATGPLTSEAFASELSSLVGCKGLYFYDALSPVIYADSIDLDIAFRGSRYGRGGDDYLNCPMVKSEYEALVAGLTGAEKTPLREFEDARFFEGCMPVEVLASRGPRTLAFGPLKPVGFKDHRRGMGTGARPHAIVQLRRENTEGSLYNMVGFQTGLKRREQVRVFTMIPGLREMRFARYGAIHRNSYIDSPTLLKNTLALKDDPELFIAGQLTGVEGYCESAAMGIVAGLNAARSVLGRAPLEVPLETMTGALIDYITDASRGAFQPMNANFGLLRGLHINSSGPNKEEKALVSYSPVSYSGDGKAGFKADARGAWSPGPGRRARRRSLERAGISKRSLESMQGWRNKVLAT